MVHTEPSLVEAVAIEMRVLITGSNGQLGTSLSRDLDSLGITKFALSRKELDIQSRSDIEAALLQFKPTHIVNSAAYTAVDKAESQVEIATSINSLGPLLLATAAREFGCKLIQISTDYVFDGEKREPYEEEDSINPINVYGETKARGEENVRNTLENDAYIIRTSWLYSEYGSNFAKTMARKALESDEVIKVVNDQIGQPTYAGDLSLQIIKFIQQAPMFGTYNATNSGQTSWYEFARAIYRLIGENENRVHCVSSKEYVTAAKRPHYSVLSHNKSGKAGVPPMRGWETALKDSIDRIRLSVS